MSTGFRYSYGDITNQDIRHLYSGDFVSANYRLRPPVSHDGINYLDRIHEDMTRKRSSKWPQKSFEYDKKYNTIMPRAPAFQKLSRTKVENVVERLTNPTDQNEPGEGQKTSRSKSAPSTVARNNKHLTSSEPNTTNRKQETSPNGSDVFERLFRSKTQITLLRQREKVVMQPQTPSTTKKSKDEQIKKETLK